MAIDRAGHPHECTEHAAADSQFAEQGRFVCCLPSAMDQYYELRVIVHEPKVNHTGTSVGLDADLDVQLAVEGPASRTVSAPAPAFPCPLHAHERLLAEHGGALFRDLPTNVYGVASSATLQDVIDANRRLHLSPQRRSEAVHLTKKASDILAKVMPSESHPG